MTIPTKKLTNGFQIPVYGLGTWQMGGRLEHNVDNDDARDIQAIRDAIDAGVTHIDTAEKYADGYTETLIGKALVGYDRSKLFLVSKVKKENLAYDQVIASCKASLERLGTSYLDLYLIHFYNPDIPLAETFRALDELKEQGLIRNIGVCNFTKERLADAQSLTKNKIVCNQVHYNLIFRECEQTGLLKYCQQNDIFLTAWRPTQYAEIAQTVPLMEEMCAKYQKTPIQIALNWLTSQPNVITISKTSRREHLEENIGAFNWALDAEDIEKLRKEYPGQQTVSNSVPLG
jgi:diketogulonate reductase-like aldo/keto reductase